MRPGDWDKPLSEIRDAFWNTPRLPLLPQGSEDLQRALYQAIQAGDVALVDKDGVERKALASSDINLGASGIRLERPGGPRGAENVIVPDVLERSRAEARLAAEAAGLLFISRNDDGTVESQSPSPGSVVAKGSALSVVITRAPQAPAEHQVVLAKTTSLVDDPSQRATLRTLLMALQNAVSDGDASHIALNVQVVATSDVKDNLLEKAEPGGINPKVTDL